jgi:hypothetical protein
MTACRRFVLSGDDGLLPQMRQHDEEHNVSAACDSLGATALSYDMGFDGSTLITC